MNCINYLPVLEAAETLVEIHLIVQRVLAQYHLTYFQEIYPGVSYEQLGEIVEEECAEDPEMSTVAYWLYAAQQRRQALLDAQGAGK